MTADYHEILDFWFEGALKEPLQKDLFGKRWFGSAPELDETLKSRFGTLLHEAEAQRLESWKETPEGILALIVLLDQFSRNIYRGHKNAFQNDAQALSLAKALVASGQDTKLKPLQRVFIYLPYEHSESQADQTESLRLFEHLKSNQSTSQEELFDSYCTYAERHAQVIERFGRFPHRNLRLGRESTAEELDFLKEPGSSFG